MKKTKKPNFSGISASFMTTMLNRIKENKRVRRKIFENGRIYIDRPLPYLVLYRIPKGVQKPVMRKLLYGESCYCFVPGTDKLHRDVEKLISGIAEVLKEKFGAFMLVEIWSSETCVLPENEPGATGNTLPPLSVFYGGKKSHVPVVGILKKNIGKISFSGKNIPVKILSQRKYAPPGMKSFSGSFFKNTPGSFYIGAEIPEIYKDYENDLFFPGIFRRMHRKLSTALKKSLYSFSKRYTGIKTGHYMSLGRKFTVKAVLEVDQKLFRIDESFNFLSLATPINVDDAFRDFKKSGFEKPPEFVYRYIPFDETLMKRDLFSIPAERIEDPVVAEIFSNKQQELNTIIDLLANRGTDKALHFSRILYGDVSEELLDKALKILHRIPPDSRRKKGRRIKATEFLKHAEKIFESYSLLTPEFQPSVEIDSDVTGIQVSGKTLLLGKSFSTSSFRLPALLAHEVETHILTCFNGEQQPFKLFSTGFSGYDELQEGLAVLSEFMTGRINAGRMRVLAARVTAINDMIKGAEFMDIFRMLSDTYRFSPRSAFIISMRIFRSGGFTKDALYLRGIIKLMDYIKKDGDLKMLFMGKFGFSDIHFVKELLYRGTVNNPELIPLHLQTEKALEKISKIKKGMDIFEFINKNEEMT